MPRGNDSDAAYHELADKFGRGVGNAEDLIDANLARQTEELLRAEALPRDPKATEEAREKLVGKKKGRGTVLDAAVRGGTTIVVVEDEDGRHHVHALDDSGKPIETDAEESDEGSKRAASSASQAKS